MPEFHFSPRLASCCIAATVWAGCVRPNPQTKGAADGAVTPSGKNAGPGSTAVAAPGAEPESAAALASGAEQRAAGGGGNDKDGASVLQHHKNASRDGLYVDRTLTKAAVARLHMDPTFKAAIEGPTFAQPLYFEGGPGGKDVVLAVTSQNRVYALDAANGAVVWQRQVGAPVAQNSLPCGNIDPLGILGTPVIDAASRAIFFDAMTTPDGGKSKKRLIFALSIDDGSTRPGWPIDVSAVVKAGSVSFNSAVQSQRGALALVHDTLYVPYGGHWGDCGNYRGWVVAVPIKNPAAPKAFATSALRGAGIWGVGGIAYDGASLFVATGNTFDTNGKWNHGEAVLRISTAPAFSGQSADYFAPSNWLALDGADLDLGGSNALVLNVPGATPSQLVAAFGKNGVTYLLDRSNLGGIGKGNGTTGEGLVSARLVSAQTQLIQAAATYRTSQSTYIAIGGGGLGCPGAYGGVTAIRVGASSPPTLGEAWCHGSGFGSPIATTTGTETIVLWLGADGNNRLEAYDADSGQILFNGGGNGDGMQSLRKWIAPIVAKGRVFVAGDKAVYAFTTR